MAAESLTKPKGEVTLLSCPFDYAQAILFPFQEANWQVTCYSDGSRYGSDILMTSVYESVYHKSFQ